VCALKRSDERARISYVSCFPPSTPPLVPSFLDQLKKGLRDARTAKKKAEEDAAREAIVAQKTQLAELRKQAREAREKAKADEDFENDSDEDEEGEPVGAE